MSNSPQEWVSLQVTPSHHSLPPYPIPLHRVCVNPGNQWQLFSQRCQLHLKKLAESKGLLLGQFLICDLKPIGFESRGAQLSREEWKKAMEAGEKEEMIRVFPTPDAEEPIDIVELEHSLLHEIGSHVFRTYRLYVVCPDDTQDALVADLKAAVKKWE
jgi:hypothetical protein